MKHLHQNDEFRFNEVLFEHRNKEYGAYVLRNESDRILTKSLFIGVSLLAAISITPFAISAFKEEAPTEAPPIIYDLIDPTVPPDVVETPPIKIEPVKPTSTPDVKQYDSTVPTPTNNAVEPVKQVIPDDAVAGFKNDFKAEPAKPNTYTPPAPTVTLGNGPAVKPQPTETDPNKIANSGELSVEASFDGGINAFRDKVMNKFDTSGFEDSGDVMKTTITFIVETNGTISGIKADGKDVSFNSEAVRVIKLIKGTWKPGKNKQGQAVRSYFKFPISMKFDN
ncbi:protein TonB [Chryseobacterium soldanellicola]|uniref:Protein TonB n=1 Tax=Chryseobacterium soldanellicola TaxID=311333 RepID=A0A1H0Y838_9FLAO|nr:hypothetical protein [Chryseobacterium soldanellicola]SDQ11211.1 protein TonB [Chryseobacterium soldanellicola]